MPHEPVVAPRAMDDEAARLDALADAEVLGVAPPAELQALVTLAAELFGVPAFLTLIDRDMLHAGIGSTGPIPPMPRCDTLCDRVIRQDGVMVFDDLLATPDLAGCAAARFGMRFYAGVPVHAPDRDGRPRALGSLCLMGAAARSLDEGGRASLRRLAGVADALLAARSAAKRAIAAAGHQQRLADDLARRNQVLAQAERLTQIGSWRLPLGAAGPEWSAGVWDIYRLPQGVAPTMEQALAPYLGDARRRVEAALAHTLATGEPFDFEEQFHPVAGLPRRVRCMGECEWRDGAAVGLVGVFQDVTDRRAVEAMLRHDASTDRLTGLANRQGFEQALAGALARARAGGPLVLAMMDLDDFKGINDTHGHAAGDQVLRAIGAALRADAPAGTIAARLGGDEFAVIVEHPGLCARPALLAARLDAALRVAVEAAPGTLAAGTVGWAAWTPDCPGAQALMRLADAALYAGKRARGRDGRRARARGPERRRDHDAADAEGDEAADRRWAA